MWLVGSLSYWEKDKKSWKPIHSVICVSLEFSSFKRDTYKHPREPALFLGIVLWDLKSTFHWFSAQTSYFVQHSLLLVIPELFLSACSPLKAPLLSDRSVPLPRAPAPPFLTLIPSAECRAHLYPSFIIHVFASQGSPGVLAGPVLAPAPCLAHGKSTWAGFGAFLSTPRAGDCRSWFSFGWTLNSALNSGWARAGILGRGHAHQPAFRECSGMLLPVFEAFPLLRQNVLRNEPLKLCVK